MYLEPKKLKTLEEYAISLALGMISLKTLENYHIAAVQNGILPEDMSCRCNTMVLDLRRMIKQYQDQLETCLELLPEDFNIQTQIKKTEEYAKTKTNKTRRSRKN